MDDVLIEQLNERLFSTSFAAGERLHEEPSRVDVDVEKDGADSQIQGGSGSRSKGGEPLSKTFKALVSER